MRDQRFPMFPVACARSALVAGATAVPAAFVARGPLAARFARAARAILVVLLVASLGACSATTRIGTILDDPDGYDGDRVRVMGLVTEALGFPGVAGAYRVDDGTGTLTVVSEEGGVPRRGADVRVEGVFHSVFTMGDQTLSVLEATERAVH